MQEFLHEFVLIGAVKQHAPREARTRSFARKCHLEGKYMNWFVVCHPDRLACDHVLECPAIVKIDAVFCGHGEQPGSARPQVEGRNMVGEALWPLPYSQLFRVRKSIEESFAVDGEHAIVEDFDVGSHWASMSIA